MIRDALCSKANRVIGRVLLKFVSTWSYARRISYHFCTPSNTFEVYHFKLQNKFDWSRESNYDTGPNAPAGSLILNCSVYLLTLLSNKKTHWGGANKLVAVRNTAEPGEVSFSLENTLHVTLISFNIMSAILCFWQSFSVFLFTLKPRATAIISCCFKVSQLPPGETSTHHIWKPFTYFHCYQTRIRWLRVGQQRSRICAFALHLLVNRGLRFQSIGHKEFSTHKPVFKNVPL